MSVPNYRTPDELARMTWDERNAHVKANVERLERELGHKAPMPLEAGIRAHLMDNALDRLARVLDVLALLLDAQPGGPTSSSEAMVAHAVLNLYTTEERAA